MSDTLLQRKPRGWTARLIKSEGLADPAEIARFEARFAGSFGSACPVRRGVLEVKEEA